MTIDVQRTYRLAEKHARLAEKATNLQRDVLAAEDALSALEERETRRARRTRRTVDPTRVSIGDRS